MFTIIFQAVKSAPNYIVILLMFFNEINWAMGCMVPPNVFGTSPDMSGSERNLILRTTATSGK